MFILMPPIRPVFSPFQRSFNYIYGNPNSRNPTALYINEPNYGPFVGSAFRNFGYGYNPYGQFNYGCNFYNPFMNPLSAVRNFQSSLFNPFANRFSSTFFSRPGLSYGQAFGPGFFVGSPYTRSPVGYYGVGPGLSNFDYWGTYTGRYNSPFTNPFLFNNFGPFSFAPNLNLGPNWAAANIMNNGLNGLNFNPGVIANA